MPSLEPRDTEGSIINALRKEVDRKQLEFVKSAKLVPVHFSSRHYSFKNNKWVFEKAGDEAILRMIEQKVLLAHEAGRRRCMAWRSDGSAIRGQTTDHVAELGNMLVGQGLIKLERRYATALPR